MEGRRREDSLSRNLGNNPHELLHPGPPLSAIDRFLWSHSSNNTNTNLSDYHQNFNPLEKNQPPSLYGFNSHFPSSSFYSNGSNSNYTTMESLLISENETLGENLAVNGKSTMVNSDPKEKREHGSSTYLVKGQWTDEEDRRLISLVNHYGVRKWAVIAERMVGRVGKQCRERWNNHLRPYIKKDVWTEEEERMLIEAHEKFGNKWAEIAKHIPGRTENSIKNHWNATKRRQNSKRKIKKLDGDKRQSTLLQDYIIKKHFNNPSTTAAATTPDNFSDDDDSTSYFTLESCNDEIDFMKTLFEKNNQPAVDSTPVETHQPTINNEENYNYSSLLTSSPPPAGGLLTNDEHFQLPSIEYVGNGLVYHFSPIANSVGNKNNNFFPSANYQGLSNMGFDSNYVGASQDWYSYHWNEGNNIGGLNMNSITNLQNHEQGTTSGSFSAMGMDFMESRAFNGFF